MNISKAQRAVLVKMRDGATITLSIHTVYLATPRVTTLSRIRTATFEVLLKKGFIAGDNPNRYKAVFTITPLGLDAIGKDK